MELGSEAAALRATIVVVARERFGAAMRSLASVLENTRAPYALVYVDAGSPPALHAELAERVAGAGGRMLRLDHFVVPNAARNLALAEVQTEYVAFVDNDVIFEEGWLEALIACADRTNAAVVGPLTLFETQVGLRVHLVSGHLELGEESGLRSLTERHVGILQPLESVREGLTAHACGFSEFHTVLVRRAFLDETGPLDEGFLSTAEHLDLALLARAAGHSVYAEPRAVVTYLQPASLMLGERAFFLERWSDDWNLRSLEHFAAKWRLDPDCSYFSEHESFLYDHQALCPLPDPKRLGSVRVSTVSDHGYAQTPAQLYAQMRDAGWPTDAIARVQRGCDLAILLFADLFRACGKPFLCHGIGTASILLRHGAPLSLALAGLCHAAYTHGRFPAGRHMKRMKQATRRRFVRDHIGTGAELLIDRYSTYDWAAGPPAAPLDTIDSRDAAIFLLRMANDLEECLDFALALTGKSASMSADWNPFLRALADELGVSGLVSEWEVAIATAPSVAVPARLRTGGSMSFAVGPWSRAREPFTQRKRITRSWWRRRLLRFQ